MFFFTGTRRKRTAQTLRRGLGAGILGLLILGTLFAVGCGGYSNSKTMPVANTVTVMVTGTSGSLSHSTPFTLTIN